ncbi:MULTISPECIES: AraC family transcriptional regulator [unclassified Imperialibacter]|uniref:helix-turn-helix domain-containing protein n=1 Tax=unclassified Imperialibacter TaxID=2629706 RepID=UPI00125A9DFC|nr:MULTISPECIES: AraC family transcriptional regulator [unclassified Imperialibacter]CAD5276626.1 AraC-type DNA-binding protein [Imperialibacter sp. 75]CAD5294685.1 AraC-type DNA-binding protein [Imperialibacter sp. 89]VVT12419.1 AraC-type DNA-binding protein [Imperialibacter sp. EC-SDR9]
MDKFIFLDAVILITAFLMLLFAFFLQTVDAQNKLSNKLFSGFLILSVFDISSFFTDKYIDAGLNFEVFRMATSLLILPLFYLYVKATCYSDFRLKPKYFLLSIPFLIANVALVPRFYLARAVDSPYIYEHFKQMLEIRFFYVLRELQYVFYMLAVFKILKNYKSVYSENHTNSSNSSYKWLFQMTVLLLVSHSFVVCSYLLSYTDYHLLLNWSNIIIGICALIISCWFVLKALKNPTLFKGVDADMIALNKELKTKPIASDEGALDAQKSVEMNSQMDFVKKYVLENEPYLEPSLTIQELSKQVTIPVRDLSLLINRHSNQHFFDFINEFRIEKAKELMKDPSNKKLTILEILYQVGFNSKSSFNTAFKKFTNQTPTAFRTN